MRVCGHPSHRCCVAVVDALRVLEALAQSVQGSKRIAEGGILPVLDGLLESSDSAVRMTTCDLLGELARFQSSTPAIWKGNRCRKLVELSRGDAPDVADCALYTLSTIAFWAEGAIAVVEAGILQISDELLESAIVGVRQWMSVTLEHLVSHESTAGAVIKMNLCRRLVELLRDPETIVAENAVHALASIALSVDGALGVCEAGELDVIDQLLESPDISIRSWACNLLGNLARFEASATVTWNANRCQKLVGLSCDSTAAVADNAVYALAKIAFWVHGSAAVVEAGALQRLNGLAQSPIPGVRRWTCEMLGHLTHHQSIAICLMEINSYYKLVTLLRDPETTVVESAVRALAFIALRADAALAVFEAEALNVIDQLLESSEEGVRECTCSLLGNLARFEVTATVAWKENRCQTLADLSRKDPPAVAYHAVYALAMLAHWGDGAAAVVAAGALQLFDDLVESSIAGVHRWVVVMLVNLARHPSLTATVMAANPCQKLVELLQYDDSDVIEPACEGLSIISQSLEGVQAVIEAGVNGILEQLLESSNSNIRRWTCNLIGNLCRLPLTIPAVWEGNRCIMVVELLHDVSPAVSASAVYALAEIASSVDGGAAVIDAGVLKRLDELMESTSVDVRRWTCVMLGRLARHQSSSPGASASVSSEGLVKLLRSVTTIHRNQK
ncbi:armadillo-type protein [Mycena albidolilacea]|uniref:Vacuolar protein 8 n=1 Tax=Mycena albidolilacea TaxID=1033008 RepID=A0AAD7EP76_9AGAR|nr:armadillo-type protein [Mycena albidolilacea]